MTRSKKRILILLLVLVLAAILLSGCGGVDPNTGEYKPGIFEPLAAPLRALIVFFHDKVLVPIMGEPNSWGWAIILVALLIRLLLLPLGLKQMKSMKEAQAKMKILQPELDKIKKKYANDKKKQQEEQMKLQQEAGIMKAQMAGCLPTLLQMPILFAFYYAIIGLTAPVATAGSNIGKWAGQEIPWYFIPDLAKPEYRQGLSWLTSDFTLQKLTQPDIWPYLVLPALLAFTQFFMTKYTQQSQPKDDSNPAAGMMGSMTWIMTLMFVWFALQVPSGLSLYWVVSNVFALVQQLYVNRQAGKWEDQLQLEDVKARVSKSAGNIEDADYKDAPAKPSPASSRPAPTKRKRRRKR